ncbi:MAG: hypothetical protein Q9192_001775 [Flavoplaca navasiana]
MAIFLVVKDVSNGRDKKKKAWLGSTNEKVHPALRAHARASYAPTSKFNFTSSSIMGVNVLGVSGRPEAAQINCSRRLLQADGGSFDARSHQNSHTRDLMMDPMLTRDIARLIDSRFTSAVCLPFCIVDDLAQYLVHVSDFLLASNSNSTAHAFHPSSGWEPLYQ